MGFVMEEQSPLTEKILSILLNSDKLTVREFRSRICGIRIRKEECNEIEKYLYDSGIIRRERIGEETYIVKK